MALQPRPLDVVELLDQSRQVADTVGVAVIKALGIDLIKDGVIEPGWRCLSMIHLFVFCGPRSRGASSYSGR